jgi:NAD-dependent deacetylase
MTDLAQRVERLAKWMLASQHMVVFTGAGISTGSGIRDFRGPDGLWTRRDKGLSTPEQNWLGVEPNSGHRAVFELQEMGKLDFLISQNIDNLHLKSGIRPELLAELHGNLSLVRCLSCDFKMERMEGEKKCPICGGKLKSTVVDFGDSLPVKDLEDSIRHARECDLFIVVGSSLVVYPAADLPRLAVERGRKLVIINQGETPYDGQVDLRFSESIGDVLPPAVKRLKELMGNNS